MDALILSCSTGGGHNAAGTAIKEELEVRGHHVTMMDPYELVSHKLAEEVGNSIHRSCSDLSIRSEELYAIFRENLQYIMRISGLQRSCASICRNLLRM